MTHSRLVTSAFFVFALFRVLSVPLLQAQDETPTRITEQNRSGDLPFAGTVGTDYERVQIANGNLVVNIPIISVPGRGSNAFTFGIWYDNRFWTAASRTIPSGATFQFWNMEKRFYLAAQGARHGLWSATQHGLMSTSYQKDCGPRLTGPSGQVMGTGSVIYMDSSGGKHAIEAGHEDGQCFDPAGSWDFNNAGPDTTGIGAVGTEQGITLADGTSLSAGGLPVSTNEPPDCTGQCPITTASAISTERDSNGNIQSVFPGGMDTLGRSLVTQITGTNSVQYRYKDSGGNDQVYTVNFQPLTITTAFNIIGSLGKLIGESSLTRQVESSLTLPNGSSYTFAYDSYGSLISIGLPTGGVIDYTWQNFPCGENTYRYVASRKVIANGQESTWTFSHTLSPGGSCGPFGPVVTNPPANCKPPSTANCISPITITVTDPLGNQSVYAAMQGNLTSASVYQGPASAGMLLRQYSITYSDLNYPTSGGTLPSLWFPTKLVTQLENGQISEKDFQYDTLSYPFTECPDPTNCATFGPITFNKTTSRGNVTDNWEYDWGAAGSGTHGPLLRHTHRDYLHDSTPAYATANIVNKVLHSIVYDGAGNKAAETDYAFDGTTPAATSGAPQHDYTYFNSGYNIRGNATAVKRWRNTDGAFLATTLTYNDLGNIVSIKDPLGHTTSYDYTDSFANTSCAPPNNSQAWVSQVTNPLSQHIQIVRYPCTGLVRAHKNQNDINAGGTGTTYTYDLMGRLSQKNLVDGGQVSTSYNDTPPVSETVTTKITSTMSLISSTIKDDLGRPIQSQVTSDPAGTDYVDTTYDILGRKATVSNPYRSHSDLTYGLTTFNYDALGRPTSVVEADGSINNTSYAGNSVTAADEVGNRRSTSSDALGRLVQVLEPGGTSAASPGVGSGAVSGIERSAQVLASPAGSGSGNVQIAGAVQWKTIANTASPGGTTRINISGSEQQLPAGVTPGTGSVTISGAGQSKQVLVTAAASGSGSFSISGAEQSKQVISHAATRGVGSVTVNGVEGIWTDFSECVEGIGLNQCPTYPDTGLVAITVNGVTKQYFFGEGDTAATVAGSLACAFHNDAASPVDAPCPMSGATVNLTARAAGAATNYSLSTSASSQAGSFNASPSGATLTGGTDNQFSPFYDHGTVSLTVNGHIVTPATSWGQGSTPATIASDLATKVQADPGSQVNAVASGSSITLTARTTGAGTNYTVSSVVSYDTANFVSSSFAAPGSPLTGGKDAVFNTINDSGTASITVNGHKNTVNWNSSATPANIASALAANINADTGASVTAATSGATVSLTAKIKGSISNYTLSSGATYDSADFTQSSFTAASFGATLTGGSPNSNAVDSGTMSVTINGRTYSKSWGLTDTPGSIASALVTAINADTSVAATLSGSTVYINPKQASTVYTLATSFTYDSQDFTHSSFTNANSISDYGTATITVGGHPDSVAWAGNDTPSTVAMSIANKINADAASTVAASAAGSAVTLTSKTTGAGTNYSLASSLSFDTADFSAASFTSTRSGIALAGGADAIYNTVFDSGTVWVTVNGFQASTSYLQGSTGEALVTALAGVFNSSVQSPVTASVSNATLNLVARQPGSFTNYSLSSGSSTSKPQTFPAPSFTVAPSGASLTGGTDSVLNLSVPAVTLYSYDAVGNLTCAVQKNTDTAAFTTCAAAPATWRPRSFTYDSLSHLLTANNPESGVITYMYDDDGNVVAKTDARGITINYSPSDSPIDALRRITKKTYSTGDPAVTYNFDQGTNGIGHLSSMTDGAGSMSYTYDLIGHIVSEQRAIKISPSSTITKNLAYTYNLNGSVATLTYPSHAVITYTPNAAGLMISAVDTTNSINYATAATFAPNGVITGFVSGNSPSFAGLTNTFSYNNRFQPINMAASAPSQTVFSIGYDFHLGNGDNGNVWGITNYKDISRNQSFTYDALNRLASAQNAGTDCGQTVLQGKTKFWGNSYGYDAWGNLLAKTVIKCGAENLSVAVLANNQISGYTYDSDGNMTHDATSGLNYSYDPENRLASGGGLTYTYDGDGKRIEKTNGSTGTLYWYGSPGIIGESDLTGTMKSEYVFFGGDRVARRDLVAPTGVFYYFSDHLKTATVITDAAGTIKSESDYYPWGGELSFVGNDTNHYKFTGKERDGETGLDYFGARFYSNGLGRFITPDWAAKATAVPYADFADPQSLNLYTYVRDLPTVRFDPDGHRDGDATDAALEQMRKKKTTPPPPPPQPVPPPKPTPTPQPVPAPQQPQPPLKPVTPVTPPSVADQTDLNSHHQVAHDTPCLDDAAWDKANLPGVSATYIPTTHLEIDQEGTHEIDDRTGQRVHRSNNAGEHEEVPGLAPHADHGWETDDDKDEIIQKAPVENRPPVAVLIRFDWVGSLVSNGSRG